METKYFEITVRDRAAEAAMERAARAQERADRQMERRVDAIANGLFLAAAGAAIVLCMIGILGGCAVQSSATSAEDTAIPAPITTSYVQAEEPVIPIPLTPVTPPTPPAEVWETPEPEPETEEDYTMIRGPLFETAPTAWAGEGEDPLEREKIEEALLAQGYLSIAVPMSYDYQDLMRTYCEEYEVPYPMALAVAEIESHFNMDAIGAVGEVGMMQLNPGPGGEYHREIEAATGMDPTTPAGNIAGGCYLLGKYLARYEDPATAFMAYRRGPRGAEKAIANGVDPHVDAAKYMEAKERWECTVNAWRGW